MRLRIRDPDQAQAEPRCGLEALPEHLNAVADQLKLQRGEVLFRAGERLKGMFWVVSGELRLVRHGFNGSDVVLQRSRAGFFAEASLISGAYHCDGICAEPSVVLQFPAAQFRATLEADASFREAWMAHLARELVNSRALCERLHLKTATDRIVHFIVSEGRDGVLTLRASRKAWAAELGLTHEALYRALRRLQQEGVINVEGERITVLRRS